VSPAQSPTQSPMQNRYLAALPPEDLERLLPSLEFVTMPLGWVIHDNGAHLDHVYFPTTSVVSLLHTVNGENEAEVAITGNEGLVGLSIYLGGKSTLSRSVVQSAGHGYRLKAAILMREFASGHALKRLAMVYTQALIAQIAQTEVCAKYHSVQQQLCRWLLLSLDRSPGNDLMMLQQQLANLLAVKKDELTDAAGPLHKERVIDYACGFIKVLDRTQLEQRACECYASTKNAIC